MSDPMDETSGRRAAMTAMSDSPINGGDAEDLGTALRAFLKTLQAASPGATVTVSAVELVGRPLDVAREIEEVLAEAGKHGRGWCVCSSPSSSRSWSRQEGLQRNRGGAGVGKTPMSGAGAAPHKLSEAAPVEQPIHREARADMPSLRATGIEMELKPPGEGEDAYPDGHWVHASTNLIFPPKVLYPDRDLADDPIWCPLLSPGEQVAGKAGGDQEAAFEAEALVLTRMLLHLGIIISEEDS